MVQLRDCVEALSGKAVDVYMCVKYSRVCDTHIHHLHIFFILGVRATPFTDQRDLQPLLLYQLPCLCLGDEYRDAAAVILRGEDKTFCSGADLGESPRTPGGT
jgi:hypothetical protein